MRELQRQQDTRKQQVVLQYNKASQQPHLHKPSIDQLGSSEVARLRKETLDPHQQRILSTPPSLPTTLSYLTIPSQHPVADADPLPEQYDLRPYTRKRAATRRDAQNWHQAQQGIPTQPAPVHVENLSCNHDQQPNKKPKLPHNARAIPEMNVEYQDVESRNPYQGATTMSSSYLLPPTSSLY